MGPTNPLHYIFLAAILIINACTSLQITKIQVLKPAQIKLGTQVDRIDIHCYYCGDIKPEMAPDSDYRTQAILSLNFLHSLEETLRKSPVFEKTAIYLQSDDSIIHKLKNTRDRVLSNNFLIILDSLFISEEIVADKSFTGNMYYANATIDRFDCKLYQTSKLELFDFHKQLDTIIWSPFLEFQFLDSFSLPPLKDRIWDAGIKAGENYAHYLAPYWDMEERKLYRNSNKALRIANKFILANQLDSASGVLRQIPEWYPKRKSLQAYAMHNMAVILEMKDQIEEAIKSETASQEYHKNPYLKDYLPILRRRKLDKAALDWQLTD